jgi:putative copper export protein
VNLYYYILVLHVLGATVWTGGHLVLSLGVLPRAWRSRDPELITRFEGPFEKVGIPALLIQVLTGLWLADRFIPDWGDWFGFEGHLQASLTLKFLLLVSTLILAVHARLRLVPKLKPQNMGFLAAHILAVTVLGVLFILVGVGIRN